MAALPPAPAPPVPPPVPEIPHLILGSLRYTLAWDVAASAFLLLVWFFGGRLESYWLSFATGDGVAATRRRHDDPGVAARRHVPRRRNARLRQLLAVWRASEEEVVSLCGADARDYLVVQRLLFLTLAAAAVPGACVLLPVAVARSARDARLAGRAAGRPHSNALDDASLFARTTVHHFPTRSPILWLVVFVSVVTVCAVETASDAVERHRAKTRTTAESRTEEEEEGEDATVVARDGDDDGDDDERRLSSPSDDDGEAPRVSSSSGENDATRFPVERTTLLLRRLPRAVAKNPESLKRALDETFGSRTYAVVVPRDGVEAKARRALGAARRRLAAARARARPASRQGGDGDDESVARQNIRGLVTDALDAEDDLRSLLELRRAKGAYVPNPGCAFVVFRDARAARAARRALQPTARGALLATLAPATPNRLMTRLVARFGPRDKTYRDPLTVATNDGNDDEESRRSDDSRVVSAYGDERRREKKNEPRAVALGVRRGVHFWRCDFAPPPSGVLWENVGVAPGRRFLLKLLVNACVSLGMIFVSSPLSLFAYAGELAANLDPRADWRWDTWLRWARVEGGARAGFMFQFAPNAAALVMIYLVIPRALEVATRAEKHLTRSGALRSLVSKEFAYFLVNLLLLLALGKAALSSVAYQVRECQWHATPDACETKFLAVLGESFVAEAAMSLCGFLCTCCTLGPAWELLSAFAWIGEAAADRRAAKTRDATRDDVSDVRQVPYERFVQGARTRAAARGFASVVVDDREDVSSSDAPAPARASFEPPFVRRAAPTTSFANAIPPPPANERRGSRARTLRPSPDARLALRRRSPRRPTFDLPGQHAFNAAALACAVAFAALAPALLVPGALFFAVRYLVHKHNLLCLHLGAVAGAGEDGDRLFGSAAADDAFAETERDWRSRAATDGGVARANHHASSVATVALASDGRLLATVARLVRVTALVHATVMAAFLKLRGTDAQAAAAFALLVATATRRRVAPYARAAARRFRERGAGARRGAASSLASFFGGDDDDDASLDRAFLLGEEARARDADLRVERPAPPETLREAKKRYRGPSGDVDEAAHELTGGRADAEEARCGGDEARARSTP